MGKLTALLSGSLPLALAAALTAGPGLNVAVQWGFVVAWAMENLHFHFAATVAVTEREGRRMASYGSVSQPKVSRAVTLICLARSIKAKWTKRISPRLLWLLIQFTITTRMLPATTTTTTSRVAATTTTSTAS